MSIYFAMLILQDSYKAVYLCRSAGNRVVVKDLKPGTTYPLRITAKNEVGFGNYVQLRVTTKSLSESQQLTVVLFSQFTIPNVIVMAKVNSGLPTSYC